MSASSTAKSDLDIKREEFAHHWNGRLIGTCLRVEADRDGYSIRISGLSKRNVQQVIQILHEVRQWLTISKRKY